MQVARCRRVRQKRSVSDLQIRFGLAGQAIESPWSSLSKISMPADPPPVAEHGTEDAHLQLVVIGIDNVIHR